jgi:hypothetical protein
MTLPWIHGPIGLLVPPINSLPYLLLRASSSSIKSYHNYPRRSTRENRIDLQSFKALYSLASKIQTELGYCLGFWIHHLEASIAIVSFIIHDFMLNIYYVSIYHVLSLLW